MAKDNSRFFEKKQAWSCVKDRLLLSYLPQYFQKVLKTRRPIFYVDCFAGKGRFDDGEPGSPCIALDIRKDVLAKSTAEAPRIDTCFIDKNYESELRENTKDYMDADSCGTKAIVGGKYEEEILPLLAKHRDENVFLYIDPYGIKALDFQLFAKSVSVGASSFEMLINMNSFGFIRAACRALGVACDEIDLEDIVEYDPTEFDSTDQSTRLLDSIAGGDYWREIILRYRREKEDNSSAGYEAESAFSQAYKQRLRKIFSYVLDMPIRLKRGGQPKYRLIHATNHPDGCNLMADNMMSRSSELLVSIQNRCQMDLFEQDVENRIVDARKIYEKAKELLGRTVAPKRMSHFTAEFFTEFGVICSTGDVFAAMKALEDEKRVLVSRNPPTTSTGRPSVFFTDGKNGQTVTIRRNQA